MIPVPIQLGAPPAAPQPKGEGQAEAAAEDHVLAQGLERGLGAGLSVVSAPVGSAVKARPDFGPDCEWMRALAFGSRGGNPRCLKW